ncbi:hypothetical protein ACHAWF_018120 [Thalassiosira exigua]
MSAKQAQALIPTLSPLDRRRWRPFVEDDGSSCYSYVLRHAPDASDATVDAGASPPSFPTSKLDEWFARLHPSAFEDEVPGSAWTDASYKGRRLLRKTAWHAFEERCACAYGYSDTWQPLLSSEKMASVLEEVASAVSRVAGLDDGELNSVNLNYYPRGGGVGYHADDEFLFDGLNRPTRIVSLSLCSRAAGDGKGVDPNHGARLFQVKRKGDEADEVRDIVLRHGDLMTMEGMFQKHYLHSVWPGDSDEHKDQELCRGERINLTWRTIVRHLDGSAECRGLICPLSGRGDLT